MSTSSAAAMEKADALNGGRMKVFCFGLAKESWQIRRAERHFVGAGLHGRRSENSRSHKPGNSGSGHHHGPVIRACSLRTNTLSFRAQFHLL